MSDAKLQIVNIGMNQDEIVHVHAVVFNARVIFQEVVFKLKLLYLPFNPANHGTDFFQYLNKRVHF